MARNFAWSWALAACLVFVGGVAVLLGIRQGYEAAPADPAPATSSAAPPDTLPAVLAGMLVTNGTTNLEHAMAAVFALAEHGEVRIDEVPRSFGQRGFTITRARSGRALAPYEQRALDIIFRARHGVDTSVDLAKARSRLTRHLRQFREALNPAMKEAGLLDDDRQTVRRRFLATGIGLFVAAAIVTVPLALATGTYGGWPMLIAASFAAVAIIALIAHAAHTPLSNEGVRRANQWRGFQRYLRMVARDREASPGDAAVRHLLPFAVALGLGSAWSSHVKRHRIAAPAWFHPLSSDSSHNGAAFAAFVASGGTGPGGHAHGAAGGGAAGGGASGAS